MMKKFVNDFCRLLVVPSTTYPTKIFKLNGRSLVFSLGFLIPLICQAEVIFDGTAGAPDTLSGNMIIDEAHGILSGTNLFHSFNTFNVNTGETATFSGNASITNVIGRVTGSSASTIDGQIGSTILNADLWLLNPNGFLFGENASLNLTGSFFASTADYLNFTDDKKFIVNDATDLSVASPEAFGFVDAEIGSILFTGGFLSVTENNKVGLVGGKTVIVGGAMATVNGEVDVISVGSAGEANIIPTGGFDTSSFSLMNDILIAENGLLFATELANTAGAGDIYIKGGKITIDASKIVSDSTEGVVGSVNIEATGDLSITASSIESSTDGITDSAAININASGITTVDQASKIFSETYASGNAGNITFNSGTDINISGASNILSHTGLDNVAKTNFPSATGNAGNITFTAGEFTTDGAFVSTNSFSNGVSGDITVDATNVNINDLTFITSSGEKIGDGGNISVSATQSIKLSGDNILITSNAGTPNFATTAQGGNIDFTSASFSMAGGAVSTDTFGTGNSGNINVSASDVNLSNALIFANSTFSINETDSIVTLASGSGGNINITADTLTLDNADPNALFSTTISSSAFGIGNAGNINLSANDIVLKNKSRINTLSAPANQSSIIGDFNLKPDTIIADTTGNSGFITINADNVSVLNGSAVAADSGTIGLGGDVTISATSSLIVDGSIEVLATNGNNQEFASNISTNALAAGNAGSTDITAKNISVTNGGLITAFTGGTGNAGNLNVVASNDISVNGESKIDNSRSGFFTSSAAAGNAGTINIQSKSLSLSNRGKIGSDSFESGDAGKITVSTNDLAITSAGVISTVTEKTGRGGDINLSVSNNAAVRGSLSKISTDSTAIGTSGDGGNINLSAKNFNMNGGGAVTSSSTGSGRAGSILIQATDEINIVGSSIQTKAEASSGGNIDIQAVKLVRFVDSTITANANGVTAGNDGGNIDIDPEFIVLSRSNVIAQANAGNGGNINLTAIQLITDQESVIDASSKKGIDGTVVVEAPVKDLSGSLIILDESLVDISGMLNSRCAAKALKSRSSFVVENQANLKTMSEAYLTTKIAQFLDLNHISGLETLNANHDLGYIDDWAFTDNLGKDCV